MLRKASAIPLRFVKGQARSVVTHGDLISGHSNRHGGGKASEKQIDTIGHEFINEVLHPCFVTASDIHSGASPNSLQNTGSGTLFFHAFTVVGRGHCTTSVWPGWARLEGPH